MRFLPQKNFYFFVPEKKCHGSPTAFMAFPSYLFLFLTVSYSSISSAGSAGMNTRDFFSSCL